MMASSIDNTTHAAVPPELHATNVRRVHRAIGAYLYQTPLLRAPRALEALCGVDGKLYFKCENFQVTKSFKPRGAFSALLHLSAAEKQLGVIARSSGNFAQGLAYAAQRLCVDACLVMPQNAPVVKLAGVRSLTDNLVLHGLTSAQGDAKVGELAQQTGRTPLSAYDSCTLMAGQATVALEVCGRTTKPCHIRFAHWRGWPARRL